MKEGGWDVSADFFFLLHVGGGEGRKGKPIPCYQTISPPGMELVIGSHLQRPQCGEDRLRVCLSVLDTRTKNSNAYANHCTRPFPDVIIVFS